MDSDKYKIVFFDKYCQTCKHRDVDEVKDPCDACLSEPINFCSHKPINWEEAETKKTKSKTETE